LAEKNYDDLSLSGGYFEQALYRGSLKEWMKHGDYQQALVNTGTKPL